MKTIVMGTYTYTPEAVLKAFVHIQERFPDLKKVEYDEEGNWLYSNSDGTFPAFDGRTDWLDQSVLEAGSDAAYSVGYPVCFTLA